MRMTLSLRETLNILYNKNDAYRIFAEYFDDTAYIWLNLGFIPHINYNFAVIEYNQRILTRVPYVIIELISSFVPVENYTHTVHKNICCKGRLVNPRGYCLNCIRYNNEYCMTPVNYYYKRFMGINDINREKMMQKYRNRGFGALSA